MPDWPRRTPARRDLLTARRGRDLFGDRYQPSRDERIAAMRAAQAHCRASRSQKANRRRRCTALLLSRALRRCRVARRVRSHRRQSAVGAAASCASAPARRVSPRLRRRAQCGVGRRRRVGRRRPRVCRAGRRCRAVRRAIGAPARATRSAGAPAAGQAVAIACRRRRPAIAHSGDGGAHCRRLLGCALAVRRRRVSVGDRRSAAALLRRPAVERPSPSRYTTRSTRRLPGRRPRARSAFDQSAGAPWVLLPPDARRAFDRVREAGPPLAQSRFGRPLLGVKCGCNEAFVVKLVNDTRRHRGRTDVRWPARLDRAHTASPAAARRMPAPLARRRNSRPHHLDARRRRRAVRRTASACGALVRPLATRASRLAPMRNTIGGGGVCFAPRAPDRRARESSGATWGASLAPAFSSAGDASVALNSCYVARCLDAGRRARLCRAAQRAAGARLVERDRRAGPRRISALPRVDGVAASDSA